MARYVTGTLVGNWLLFLLVPEERDEFQEQINRAEGWTLGALAVLEGALERGIQYQLAKTGILPDAQLVAAAFNRLNGKYGPITPATVFELITAAQSGTAANFEGLNPTQRLVLYPQLFASCMKQSNATESERAALIVAAEKAAIAQGWEPDLVPDRQP